MLAAYGLSGAAGLIYEVAWTRLLTLRLGHTTAAASTVVAAFMGGLALGSVLGGLLASRVTAKRALHLYIGVEIAVAVLALSLPLELDAFTPVLRAVYGDGRSTILFPAIRVIATLAILCVPAAALGASFPLATRAFEAASGRAGALYAVNTAGAAAGAAAAGFLLLPNLGLLRTTLVGVSATVAAALLALLAAGRMRGHTHAASNGRNEPRGEEPAGSSLVKPNVATRRPGTMNAKVRATDAGSAPPWIAPALAAATGSAGFILEVGWTRVFALIVGPSTYAFAAVLVCIVAALAAGSIAGHALARLVRRPLMPLAALLGAGACLAWMATVSAGTTLPARIAGDLAASGDSASTLLMRHTGWAARILVPPVFCVGAVFPMLLALGRDGGGAGARRASQVYAANTLAGVGGALAAGFVLLPALGLERTLQCATVVLAWGAMLAVAAVAPGHRLRALALLPALVAPVLLVSHPRWDRALIVSGAYKYAQYQPAGSDPADVLRAGMLRYYRDGAASTVAVRELAGVTSLSIDGKVDASTGGDMTTQKVLAHLPLLLHPDPARVLVIGLGSGVTAGAALAHPVESVDVVELSPEVVEAARFFVRESGDPTADPRMRLIVGDGRSHLLLGQAQYDVIVSEPSNPWMAGVAALFTREFFEAARDRLAPGGILCQWSHTYDISAGDLRSIAATFASVFPEGTMWLVGEGDLLLIGSDQPMGDPMASIAAHWTRPGVADDLARGSVTEPFSLLSTFAGGPEQLRRFAANAPVQRDDRLALEYSAPFALNGGSHDATVDSLLMLQAQAWTTGAVAAPVASAGAASWTARASMLLAADAFDSAYASFDRALALDAGRIEAARGLVRSAAARGRLDDAEARLAGLAGQQASSPAPLIALSQLYFATGRVDEARAAAAMACEIDSKDLDAFAQIASVHAESGDLPALAEVVDTMTSRFPQTGATAYYLAALRFLQGDLALARDAARDAVAKDERSAPARNLLGAIHATGGDVVQARSALTAALALDPRDPAAYVNLARLEAQAGRRDRAAALYAEALTLDPASIHIRQDLESLRHSLR
ncbi:MAG: tetratricopeptide repeat protein [Vicinamibacterales bacterium]